MSSIHDLIQGAIRADERRRLSFSVQRVGVTINYGIQYTKWAQQREVRDQNFCAKHNARSIVICGGCTSGLVRVRSVDGRKTNERKPHADCLGYGLRINRRYGRCGKGGHII